jgi:hypothetical protein
MTEALHDSLVDLLVRRLDTSVSAAVMVDWAVAALSAGLDTPALVILAGLPPASILSDAEPWFEKTLVELGIKLPPAEDLRRAYVSALSRSVLAGTLKPVKALDLIHHHAISPLGHPSDLKPWCFVWERLAPSDFHSLDDAGVELEARTLASAWARRPFLASLQTPDASGRIKS